MKANLNTNKKEYKERLKKYLLEILKEDYKEYNNKSRATEKQTIKQRRRPKLLGAKRRRCNHAAQNKVPVPSANSEDCGQEGADRRHAQVEAAVQKGQGAAADSQSGSRAHLPHLPGARVQEAARPGGVLRVGRAPPVPLRLLARVGAANLRRDHVPHVPPPLHGSEFENASHEVRRQL